jgi:hypothetical protein
VKAINDLPFSVKDNRQPKPGVQAELRPSVIGIFYYISSLLKKHMAAGYDAGKAPAPAGSPVHFCLVFPPEKVTINIQSIDSRRRIRPGFRRSHDRPLPLHVSAQMPPRKPDPGTGRLKRQHQLAGEYRWPSLAISP